MKLTRKFTGALILLAACALPALAQSPDIEVEITTASGARQVIVLKGAISARVLSERRQFLDFDLGEAKTVGAVMWDGPERRETFVAVSDKPFPARALTLDELAASGHIDNDSGAAVTFLFAPRQGVRYVRIQHKAAHGHVEARVVGTSPDGPKRVDATFHADEKNSQVFLWFRVVFARDPSREEYDAWRARSVQSLEYIKEMERAKAAGRSLP